MAVNNKVKITIDGKSFTLMGPETEEHMMQVAGYIDQKMMEIRKNSKAVAIDSSLAYILTSINVANDYFKEVKQHLEQEETMEELRLQVMSEKAKTAELQEQIEQLERDKRRLERKLQEYQAEEEAANEGLHTSKVRPRKR